MLESANKKRVIVYIDGFNLYHAINDMGNIDLLWPSVTDLSKEIIKSQSELLKNVVYFIADAKHIYKNNFRAKQKKYLKQLEKTGTEVIYGKFKKKYIYCKKCTQRNLHHEEKETDVNIAVRIVSDAYENNFDTAYIISGDTDLLAPIRLIRERFTNKEIVVIGPPHRRLASELRINSTRSQMMTRGQLMRNKLKIT